MNVHMCHGSITLNPRANYRWVWSGEKGGGGIDKHQPTEQSSCDIHNRMGIFLALKNNLLYDENTHNSFVIIIIAFSFDFLSDKISEFSYWEKRKYFNSCVLTEKSQSTMVHKAENV